MIETYSIPENDLLDFLAKAGIANTPVIGLNMVINILVPGKRKLCTGTVEFMIFMNYD